MYIGAILTVDNAIVLAKEFGLSEKIIGLTVIAIIDVINSGSEVPIAITVNPIIFSDNPNSFAKTIALSTVSIAPIYKNTIPIPISPADFR